MPGNSDGTREKGSIRDERRLICQCGLACYQGNKAGAVEPVIDHNDLAAITGNQFSAPVF